MNKRVDFWLETLAYWLDEIKAAGADRPERVHDYETVIKEIHNHNKQKLIGETVGDKLLRMTENRTTKDWRVEQDICDDYFYTEPSC